MDIDEIVKQHREALLDKSQSKKDKSFWLIFWEEFSKTREELDTCRAITVLFPVIAAIVTLIISLVLCGGHCSDNCCSECLICAAAAGTGPIGLISILFMLVPFAIYAGSNGNTTVVIIVIADIVTAVMNLIVLEMYDRNAVITSIAFIIYIIFIYLMFKKPFLKWYKINK